VRVRIVGTGAHPPRPDVRKSPEVTDAMKPSRSLVVSWLLGASVVALVTFSFEALSAREAAQGRCPVTGAVALAVETDPPTCPAMRGKVRRPTTGDTARPAVTSGRCPAAGGPSSQARAGLSI
jgi:hypothetical protein